MKLQPLIASLLAITFLPVPGHSLESLTLYYVQSALRDHGYTLSEPDGLMGPATRAALLEFSKDYGSSSDPDAVLKIMVSLSVSNRRPITDQEVIEKIKSGVAKEMRDPSSVQIRNVYSITQADSEIFCGEVNGKNAFGAYVGFTPFYGLMSYRDFLAIHIDGNDGALAELNCLLSFPIKR